MPLHAAGSLPGAHRAVSAAAPHAQLTQRLRCAKQPDRLPSSCQQVAHEAFSDGLLSADELDATRSELRQTYCLQLQALGVDPEGLPDPTIEPRAKACRHRLAPSIAAPHSRTLAWCECRLALVTRAYSAWNWTAHAGCGCSAGRPRSLRRLGVQRPEHGAQIRKARPYLDDGWCERIAYQLLREF